MPLCQKKFISLVVLINQQLNECSKTGEKQSLSVHKQPPPLISINSSQLVEM